jgi:hypothetical protein
MGGRDRWLAPPTFRHRGNHIRLRHATDPSRKSLTVPDHRTLKLPGSSTHLPYPGRVGFTLSTLDTPAVPAEQRHIYVGSKAPRWTIHDALPQNKRE